MGKVHLAVGAVIAATFIVLTLWGVAAWIRNKTPGKAFWNVLAFGQGMLVVQVLVGVVMFFARGGMHWLHYAYGTFPLLVLGVAHRATRKLDGIEWAAFSVAGFFIFGLQTRGLMTGLWGG